MKRKKTTPKRKIIIDQATALGAEGRWIEAEAIWRAFLKSEPNNVGAIFNLAFCIEKRSDNPADRFAAAEQYEKIITHPNADMEMKANAMNQMGLMLKTVGEIEKAATAFAFGLSMFPNHGACVINLADCHRELGNFDKADEGYRIILDQSPDNADAHMCAGMLALLLGDWKRGWEEYRWRFRSKNFTTKPFETDKPLLERGGPIDGKILLLTEEQGFGDSFQFLRYTNIFTMQGAKVIFRCQSALHAVASGVFGLHDVCSNTGECDFDYHLPLLDAPWYFDTTSETIPEAHCIRPVVSWPHRTLQNINPLRKRIALAWAGSPTHGKDLQRSIQPEMFQAIIDAHPEHDFYSIQAGPRAHECARLRSVVDLAPQIENWTDTAQFLMCMDLLVTVDTAVAHLCGAVGIPAWILLPHSPDWRWGLHSKFSPWYPKAKLYRQEKDGDWAAPINLIIKDL